MKAYVCKEFGPVESHKVEEIEDPRAEAGQVVVDVKAAGVSFPDVLIVQGKYQFQPPFPFSPGGEIAGVISEVGEGVVDWKIGDRVIAMTGNGGIAEKVVAFEMTLMPLPETMDFRDGAAFPLNYGTTYHALKQRGQLQAGETLLVTGAGGGVGTTAIEIGKAMGARVIAAASTDEKLEIAKNLGDPNIFREVVSTLRLMSGEFRTLPLDGAFDVELNDYLFEDIATPPLPNLPQPTVNTQANIQNVDPTTNLTSTETALLSPEEQVIRQRLRKPTGVA